jgi:hypothetical protein
MNKGQWTVDSGQWAVIFRVRVFLFFCDCEKGLFSRRFLSLGNCSKTYIWAFFDVFGLTEIVFLRFSRGISLFSENNFSRVIPQLNKPDSSRSFWIF